MFAAAARIARAVTVPVTMDAEAGYGMPAADLVRRLLEAGVAGCNLVDTDHRGGGITPHSEHRRAGRRLDHLNGELPIGRTGDTDTQQRPPRT
jgi:hypothetical protein